MNFRLFNPVAPSTQGEEYTPVIAKKSKKKAKKKGAHTDSISAAILSPLGCLQCGQQDSSSSSSPSSNDMDAQSTTSIQQVLRAERPRSQRQAGFSASRDGLVPSDSKAFDPGGTVEIGTRVQCHTTEVAPPVQHGTSEQISYLVSKTTVKRNKRGALMDRGANGGIAGNDCRIVFEHQREVDVTGIDNHEISALKIVDAVTVVMTQDGPRLAYMRQYAYLGQGRSIHSCGQVEYNQNEVHDKSMKIKGWPTMHHYTRRALHSHRHHSWTTVHPTARSHR